MDCFFPAPDYKFFLKGPYVDLVPCTGIQGGDGRSGRGRGAKCQTAGDGIAPREFYFNRGISKRDFLLLPLPFPPPTQPATPNWSIKLMQPLPQMRAGECDNKQPKDVPHPIVRADPVALCIAGCTMAPNIQVPPPSPSPAISRKKEKGCGLSRELINSVRRFSSPSFPFRLLLLQRY